MFNHDIVVLKTIHVCALRNSERKGFRQNTLMLVSVTLNVTSIIINVLIIINYWLLREKPVLCRLELFECITFDSPQILNFA